MIWRTGSFWTSFTSTSWGVPAMSSVMIWLALRMMSMSSWPGSVTCCGSVPWP